jgi:Zn-dependent protease with chaperone function/Zn-finger nucleic acid-binding protein
VEATLVGERGQRATTFFEVERDARWRIWALFGLLVAVVWVCLAPLSLLLTLLLHVKQRGSVFSTAYWAYPSLGSTSWLHVALETVAVTVALGLGIAAVAWLATRVRARPRLLRALHAGPLDPQDTYHQRLANVVDELRIAAGLTQLDTVVVRTLSVSAFSFADPHGPTCLGITEGALSRLTRPQLQAVVAHEAAHLASRDCLVATRACLLFLGVRRVAEAHGKGATIAALAGYLAICFAALVPLAPVQIGLFWVLVALLVWTAIWLSFWMAATGASVVDLALSRQREFAADTAAVHFTADPASLAEALQVIEWQQTAGLAVPRVLAPLYVAPTGGEHHADWRRFFETHPPLAERIGRLQVLARQQGQTLWERRAEVERRVQAREHAVPARMAPGRAGRLAAAGDAEALCPRCAGKLHELVYEGSAIIECTVCAGVGATKPQVGAILVRRDWGFTPEQLRMADLIEHDLNRPRPSGAAAGAAPPLPLNLPWSAAAAEPSRCPLCEEPMHRAPWSLAYPLPTDYCAACDLHWFDRDEIEVLQILVERQTEPGQTASSQIACDQIAPSQPDAETGEA